MEWTLQQQGFDLCYDKRLYDRLATSRAESVRGHLQADRRLPGAPAAVHREPRRAARGGDVRAGAGARGRGRDVDAAGRAALPRRPARGPAHAHPGLPRPRPRRAAPTATCARSTRGCCGPSPTATCATATGGCATATGWPDNDSHRALVAWCWSNAEPPPRRRQPLRRARPGPGAPAVARTSPGGAGRSPDRLDGRALRARRGRARRRGPLRRPRPLGVALPLVQVTIRTTATITP